ncbi:nucleic acid binding [Ascochyta rabiei]|uniref:Nucleic acid binding n=1 Tax=Didymella rabiei TaxID=5454 RepID=A0A163DIX5_DIDRA|nr:nucleic acid binding [Ascochyta rabiei]
MSTVATAQAPVGASGGADGGSRGRRPRNRNRNRAPNETSDAQNEGQSSGEQQSQRGGRSGRGRGRGRGGHSLVPSQVLQAMPGQGSDTAPTPTPTRGGHRGRGGSGRGGPGRGGAQRFPQRTAAGGRQFGGQLTTEDDAESVASASLQADAPEFEPGRPLVGCKPRAPKEKQPQAPKSTAPDIATRTHEDIDNGHYECAICTEDIKRRSKGVWSCRTCWTVFHLGCIKKWSTNEGSAAARQQAQDGEAPPPRQWRCPGCNLPKDVLPKNFSSVSVILQWMVLPQSKNGLDRSNVQTRVVVSSTAASMPANKHATDRTPIRLTVHDLPTLSPTVLAARRVFHSYQMLVERTVGTPFRTAQSLATQHSTVVTNASRRAIKANAGPVWRRSRLHVDVVVQRLPRSAIKEPRRLHSACASVVSRSTVDDTSAVSTVALESAKPPSGKQTEGSHALWTQPLNGLEKTSRQNTSAPVHVVVS